MRVTHTSAFVGLDQRKPLTSDLSVAGAMRNFRVNDDFSLSSRAETALAGEYPDVIEGIFSGELNGEKIRLIAFGGKLYRDRPEAGTMDELGEIGAGHCEFFTFGGRIYVLNGCSYSRYDGSVFSEVEGYVPTIAVSCAPDGSGSVFEQYNLLTDKRKMLFGATGVDDVFHLAEKDITEVTEVRLDGARVPASGYSVDCASGTVTFGTPPAEGINNLEIVYRKSGAGERG